MKLHNYQVLVFKNTMRFEASDPVHLCQEVMSWKIPWTLMRWRKKRMWRTWSKVAEVKFSKLPGILCGWLNKLYTMYIYIIYMLYTYIALQMQNDQLANWQCGRASQFLPRQQSQRIGTFLSTSMAPAVQHPLLNLKTNNFHSENDFSFPLLLDSLWVFRIWRGTKLHRISPEILHFQLEGPALFDWYESYLGIQKNGMMTQ